MSVWQTIDSVPKDGTAVLVVPDGGEYNASVAIWRSGSAGARWQIPETNRYLMVEPTHWMPLPEPPSHEAFHYGDTPPPEGKWEAVAPGIWKAVTG